MGSDIPSPRQGECKDRGATVLEHLRRTLYWRDYPKWLTRRRSNAGKQRRRLLAERLERDAERSQDSADIARAWGKVAWANYGERHDKRASKLRTIAARLRGTSG